MCFHSRQSFGVKLGLTFVAAVAVPAQESPEARPTGLPIKKATWTFNLDAGLGVFGFMNSLYTPAHPDPSFGMTCAPAALPATTTSTAVTAVMANVRRRPSIGLRALAFRY